VLVRLGGATWARDGFRAPDGGYGIVSGIILYVWVAVVNGFLTMAAERNAFYEAAPSQTLARAQS
jgi:hypothetical protein